MKHVIFFLIFLPVFIYAQELNVTVTVNTDHLRSEEKDRVESFANDVQNYLNRNKYSDGDFQGAKIQCNLMILFSSAANETDYNAQVVVTSERPVYGTNKNSLMLQILDDNWKFSYQKGQAMYYDRNQYDPLTSFLDFYAYLIIGFDADSYDPQGGDKYFLRAVDVAMTGSSKGPNQGWDVTSASYNRRRLLEDLTSEKYHEFRQDYFQYHYNGIDLFAKHKDRAQANIAKLVTGLFQQKDKMDPRSVLLRIFFTAKCSEIIDYLKDYPKKEDILEKLKIIDPAHISKYNEALKIQAEN